MDIDIDIDPKEDYNPEETKQLEQNYYKDGFVPTMKALSNLTKSLHSLSNLDQQEKQDQQQSSNEKPPAYSEEYPNFTYN